jgi:hypothetical protein
MTPTPTKTQAELDHYIRANGFRPGQSRIGVVVWLSPGARPKHELAIGLTHACLYTRSPRSLVAKWELRP